MNNVIEVHPLPWKQHPEYPDDVIDACGSLVLTAYSPNMDDVSAYALDCVNNHEQLVTALRHLLSLAKHLHPDPHTYIIEAEETLKEVTRV